MDPLIQILICGMAGTLLMTGFSYLVSLIYNQQFVEPVLLNRLLYRGNVVRNPKPNHVLGWLTHFTIGFVFNGIYYLLQGNFTTTLLRYVLFGTLSGVMACVVWEIAFLMHPNPPAANKKGFYLHLFIAHIIFGVASWLPFCFSSPCLLSLTISFAF